MDAPVGTHPAPAAPRGDGHGLLRAIEARLPDVRLLTDVTDRESYRRDETAYLAAGLPLAVALPASTQEVAALVKLCGEFDVPIVPRGAGTGLSGAAAGIEGALTISHPDPGLCFFGAIDEVRVSGMIADESVELGPDVALAGPPAVRFDARGGLDPLYHDGPVVLTLSRIAAGMTSATAEVIRVERSGALR